MANSERSVSGPQLPLALGDLQVVGVLGRGASGVVLLARLPAGDLVAIKRLIGDQIDDAVRSRFRREVRIVTSLDHPHIVRTEGFFEDHGEVFLVMEHVAGPSLEELIKAAPLSTANALAVLSALSDALSYAHGRRVLHRDLTPANVLMSEDDGAKLGDFGVAKILGTDRMTSPLSVRTHTGAVLGTPSYMSPEAVEGTVDLTAQADIYSLGVLAYRLLVGRLPFPYDGDVLATLNAHLSQRVPQPRELGIDLPPALEAALLRALEKDPTARQPDAGAFWTEVAAAADSAWPRWRDRVDLKEVCAVATPSNVEPVPGKSPNQAEADESATIVPDWTAKSALLSKLSTQWVDPIVFEPIRRRRWPGILGSTVLGLAVASGVVALTGPKTTTAIVGIESISITARSAAPTQRGCPGTLVLIGHITTNGASGQLRLAWSVPAERPRTPRVVMVRAGELSLIETTSVTVTPTGPTSASAFLRVLGPRRANSASIPLSLRCS